MDMQYLQTITSVTNQRLDCNIADLASITLSQAVQPYFVDGMIHVREITDRLQTDTSVTIHGIGNAFPFMNMPVTLVFSLSQDQSITLTITATGPAQWTLDQAFPMLQRSVFSLLQFAPSPILSLSSAPPCAREPSSNHNAEYRCLAGRNACFCSQCPEYIQYNCSDQRSASTGWQHGDRVQAILSHARWSTQPSIRASCLQLFTWRFCPDSKW